jgi:hypothetical protein
VGLLLLVAVVWAIFWVTQIVDVMGRRREDFVDGVDKVVWVALMTLVPVLGCIAYWISKPVRTSSPRSLERELEALRRARAGKAGGA